MKKELCNILKMSTYVLSLGQDIEGYQPLWFEKRTDETGDNIFIYKGSYWEAKERQDWSQCPQIF